MGGRIVKRVGMPDGKVSLLGTYDADHDGHAVYSLGMDENGQYYSVEEHEYNIGSAYSFYTDYYVLEDSETADLKQRVRARGNSQSEPPPAKDPVPVCGEP